MNIAYLMDNHARAMVILEKLNQHKEGIVLEDHILKFLLAEYEKALDNINSHSYAQP
jgi:hypothetical protein